MARTKLLENIVSLGAVQLASYAIPLVTLPYLAKVLGPEALGKMAFAMAFSQIFLMLTDYGFNLSAAREASLHRDDPQKITELFCSVSTIRLLFMAAGFALLLVLTQVVPRFASDAALYRIGYILVLGNSLFPLWLFQGLEQLRIVGTIQIATRCSVLAGIFLLVKTPQDILTATFLQSTGNLLGAIFAIPALAGILHRRYLAPPSKAALSIQLREGWHVFLSTAAINFYTSSNAFVLGLLTTPIDVAYYHVADKIVRAVQTMYGPVSQSIYPHVSQLAQHDPVAALAFNRKVMVRVGLTALVISIGICLTSPLIVRLLFGTHFQPAAGVLAVLSFVPCIVVLSNILGIQTMLPFGMKREFSRILLAAAGVNFVVFIPLAWLLGAIGAATANLIVEIFVTGGMAIALHHRGRNPLTATSPG